MPLQRVCINAVFAHLKQAYGVSVNTKSFKTHTRLHEISWWCLSDAQSKDVDLKSKKVFCDWFLSLVALTVETALTLWCDILCGQLLLCLQSLSVIFTGLSLLVYSWFEWESSDVTTALWLECLNWVLTCMVYSPNNMELFDMRQKTLLRWEKMGHLAQVSIKGDTQGAGSDWVAL